MRYVSVIKKAQNRFQSICKKWSLKHTYVWPFDHIVWTDCHCCLSVCFSINYSQWCALFSQAPQHFSTRISSSSTLLFLGISYLGQLPSWHLFHSPMTEAYHIYPYLYHKCGFAWSEETWLYGAHRMCWEGSSFTCYQPCNNHTEL